MVPDSSPFHITQKSVYSNITQQDLIILGILDEQQKNQRAIKLENKSLKQTRDEKLAESFAPVNKILEDVDNYTKTLGEVFENCLK